MNYRFKTELWLYPGSGAWHFATLPKDISQEIKAVTAEQRRGFGSVKVTVSIGEYSWGTSIFPDKTSGCYLLPIKKEARRHNDLQAGDQAEINLILIGY